MELRFSVRVPTVTSVAGGVCQLPIAPSQSSSLLPAASSTVHCSLGAVGFSPFAAAAAVVVVLLVLLLLLLLLIVDTGVCTGSFCVCGMPCERGAVTAAVNNLSTHLVA